MDLLRRLFSEPDVPLHAEPQGVAIRAMIVDPPASGKFVKVVGVSAYQGSLERVAGGRNIDGANVPDHKAGLLAEPSNPYDPNAIQVQILGYTVGYLSRANAIAYRSIFERVWATGYQVGCLASISGGWGGGDYRSSFGVRLALGTPAELAVELEEWIAKQ